VYITVISLDEQIHGAFNEIASSDSKIRIRGYRRLHQLADDYSGRPMLDYDDQANVEGEADSLKAANVAVGGGGIIATATTIAHVMHNPHRRALRTERLKPLCTRGS
jgi:hypothetical protein